MTHPRNAITSLLLLATFLVQTVVQGSGCFCCVRTNATSILSADNETSGNCCTPKALQDLPGESAKPCCSVDTAADHTCSATQDFVLPQDTCCPADNCDSCQVLHDSALNTEHRPPHRDHISASHFSYFSNHSFKRSSTPLLTHLIPIATSALSHNQRQATLCQWQK